MKSTGDTILRVLHEYHEAEVRRRTYPFMLFCAGILQAIGLAFAFWAGWRTGCAVFFMAWGILLRVKLRVGWL
jgi:hypothetical protein